MIKRTLRYGADTKLINDQTYELYDTALISFP